MNLYHFLRSRNNKSLILIQLALLLSFSAYGQSIEISGGPNLNTYFDLNFGDNYNDHSTNQPGMGGSFSISYLLNENDHLPIRFSLLIDHYTGNLNSTAVSQCCSLTLNAEIRKTTIGFAYYPLNLRFFNRIWFIFGGVQNVHLYNKTTGYIDYRQGPDETRVVFGQDTFQIHRNYFFGVDSRLSYEIPLKNSWYMVPQYHLYLGLFGELLNVPEKPRSMRHSLQLGFVHKFGK